MRLQPDVVLAGGRTPSGPVVAIADGRIAGEEPAAVADMPASVGRATGPQQSAYKSAREWMDDAIALIKPGVGPDRIAHAFPRAEDIGFESEMAAFGLNFCHGHGLGLHERPISARRASRTRSFVTPKGAQIITLFPADELPIASRY